MEYYIGNRREVEKAKCARFSKNLIFRNKKKTPRSNFQEIFLVFPLYQAKHAHSILSAFALFMK